VFARVGHFGHSDRRFRRSGQGGRKLGRLALARPGVLELGLLIHFREAGRVVAGVRGCWVHRRRTGSYTGEDGLRGCFVSRGHSGARGSGTPPCWKKGGLFTGGLGGSRFRCGGGVGVNRVLNGKRNGRVEETPAASRRGSAGS